MEREKRKSLGLLSRLPMGRRGSKGADGHDIKLSSPTSPSSSSTPTSPGNGAVSVTMRTKEPRPGPAQLPRCESLEEMERPIVGVSFPDSSMLYDDSRIASCTVDTRFGDISSTFPPGTITPAAAAACNGGSETNKATQDGKVKQGRASMRISVGTGSLSSYRDSSSSADSSQDNYEDVEIINRKVILKANNPPVPSKSGATKVSLIQTVHHEAKYERPVQTLDVNTSDGRVKSLISMIENQKSGVAVATSEPQTIQMTSSAPTKVVSPTPITYEDDDLYEDVEVRGTNSTQGLLRPKENTFTTTVSLNRDLSDDDDDETWVEWSDYDDEEQEYENLQDYMTVDTGMMEKDQQVVYELMTTERTYVEKLQLLQQARKDTEKFLGKAIAKDMFPYIDNIYLLHKENMLPHLEDRVKKWVRVKKIGDIMKKLAPFLKLYTDYIKNFDKTLNLMSQWRQKSPGFAKKLQTVNAGGLKVEIETHMLEPVQRVPRYELLLKEYLKHSPKDSTDRRDVEEALKSVSEAARLFESRIQHETRMCKLISLQQQIDSPVSIVTSSRELVKEGKILKVCAKNGKLVNRYLFLFNDLLLFCKEQFIHIAGVTPKYQVKFMMDLDGMQITDGENLDTPHTFYVKTRQKALELAAEDEDGKGEWTQTMWKVVGDKMRQILQKKLNRRTRLGSVAFHLADPESLGKKAPVFVHNHHVTQCMLCAKDFKTFRKKHHCKGCGAVVCGVCSPRTVKLKYDPGREKRVCDECYLQLQDIRLRKAVSPKAQQGWSRHNCLFKDYMLVSGDIGRSWQRRFVAVNEVGALQFFKAQQDISPVESIPLSQSDVSLLTLKRKEKDEHMVHLATKNNEFYIRDNSAEKVIKFSDTLKEAVEEAKNNSTA